MPVIRTSLALTIPTLIILSATGVPASGATDANPPAADAASTAQSRTTSTGPSARAIDRSLDSMARLLASAVDDEELRQQIHRGVAQRFDGDTNVLFSELATTSGVRGALAATYRRGHAVGQGEALGVVDRMAAEVPRLQVAVPANFEDWDPATFTPLVGYTPESIDDTDLETVTAYDAQGRVHALDTRTEPTRPVIVLGVNERTDDSGALLEDQVVESQDASSGTMAIAAESYLVELNTVHLEVDHEPWNKGAAEISYRAQSRGCGGVDHTDYDVTGLDYAGNNRTWWDGDGLNLGHTSCPVIIYWWEDDSGAYDFNLSYKGIGLNVHMADGDDKIGGHEHIADYFKGETEQWYSGLDDIWYKME